MAMSINTNVGAMLALQNLNKTNRGLEQTQLRVTTGLRINGPKDDAATFAIAQNMRGDIAGMTESLGVAFNSTFVALLISIVLMFLLHQLQRLQDGMLVDTQEYCESFLLNRISAAGLSKADQNTGGES